MIFISKTPFRNESWSWHNYTITEGCRFSLVSGVDEVITKVIIMMKEATMKALKVTTIGNSAGVILPKEVLERLRVSKGDEIYLIEEPDGFRITPYDRGFVEQMEMAEEIMRGDRDVLKVLAK